MHNLNHLYHLNNSRVAAGAGNREISGNSVVDKELLKFLTKNTVFNGLKNGH